MRPKHAALAVLVAVAWGVQFVIVDEALDTFPPLLFTALRFMLVAFPAILFVPRPRVPWTMIAGVGLSLSAAQFGLQYLALSAGMPPGLLSLVLQSQVGFTLLIALVVLRERPGPQQVIGLVIAAVGVTAIVLGYSSDRQAPLLPLVLVLLASLAWGLGNVLTRACGSEAGFGLIIWSSLAVPVPLSVLSVLVEGPKTMATSLAHPSGIVIGALLYTVLVASLFGYGSWSKLLSTNKSYLVAPFSLLVPPIGMLTAWIVQSEVPTVLEACGGALMLFGALLCLARLSRGSTTAATESRRA